ncbi:MAG: S-layer homology domain-containing protein, partial [Oscillospiraceae bacterium]
MKAKRSLALLLALVMTLSLLAIPAFAADNKTRATPLATKFSDTAGHWAAAAIDRWSGFGVVVGDETGTFRPNADLTRGEMATVITNLLGLTNKGKNPYADLKGGEWYADAVLKCTAAGIIYGDGVNCNATAKITRQEATVMLCRAVGIKPAAKPNLSAFSDAASVAPWAAGHVSAMSNAGIISGVGGGLFVPTININRASTMTILDKAISEYINKAGEYTITSSGLVVVTVPDVVLKNSKLNDLLVAEGVGNGDFTLNSTKVTGNTTVRGGGVNSFIVMGDSEMGEITVSKVDG